jgi:hypothetical protein
VATGGDNEHTYFGASRFPKIQGRQMRTEPRPDEIRTLVIGVFKDLGATITHSFDLKETILVSDGRYAARSYRVDQLVAMWLIDVGILQFYDADGSMIRQVSLFEEMSPQRMAA